MWCETQDTPAWGWPVDALSEVLDESLVGWVGDWLVLVVQDPHGNPDGLVDKLAFFWAFGLRAASDTAVPLAKLVLTKVSHAPFLHQEAYETLSWVTCD